MLSNKKVSTGSKRTSVSILELFLQKLIAVEHPEEWPATIVELWL